MKIGLNCLAIAPNYRGGVNSFTFGLLDGLAQSRRPHKYVIFSTSQCRPMFEPYLERRNFSLVEIDAPGREAIRSVFHKVPRPLRLLRRWLPLLSFNAVLNGGSERILEKHADMLYAPYCPPPVFPFPDKPTVYSIHDVQHVHYPEFFTAEQIQIRKEAFQNCTQHAALVQASSEQMRDDFLANFPVLTPEKVVVIQEGVKVETFRARVPDLDVRKKYALPQQFMYFPAQLWHHKNHITVLKALVRLKARGITTPLVMSGARYEGSEQLFEFIKTGGLGDRVFYLDVVPFEDLIALHQAARFLITAVLYESSSIPILEAAAAGTPVIASETPANLERARDLQLNLFSPKDDAALAALLEKIWDDEALQSAQIRHNSRAIEKFDWPNIAEDYLDAFERLMGGRAQKQ
jgi:glycosyltransferase involved in cell wall biosynthesis